MSELRVSKEKVISAAKTCGDAKRVLEILFPEAFESTNSFKLNELVEKPGYPALFSKEKSRAAGFTDNSFMQVRASGLYADRAFYLDSSYINWELKKEDSSNLVLIPTKKL